jgi:hypothetical protein
MKKYRNDTELLSNTQLRVRTPRIPEVGGIQLANAELTETKAPERWLA